MKFWLDLYGRFARRVLPKRSSTVLLPELFVRVFFLYQTFTMSTIWWTWKSASNVSRLQKNASVSVRTKCNISQSRWMSFLKVCVHYYVFYLKCAFPLFYHFWSKPHVLQLLYHFWSKVIFIVPRDFWSKIIYFTMVL